MTKLTWYPIKEARSPKIIGAAAFDETESLVVVTSFYEDKDMDNSGEIEFAEKLNPFGMQGRAITACFTGLKSDPDLWIKDAQAINQGWANAFTALGGGLIADGVYMTYFNRAVGSLAGMAAKGITANPVKNYAIRKGMEKAVKTAYSNATR